MAAVDQELIGFAGFALLAGSGPGGFWPQKVKLSKTSVVLVKERSRGIVLLH